MANKTPTRPRQAPKSSPAPARVPGVPAPVGDNSALREEEERVQLISTVAKLTQADIEVERAKGPLKAAQEARKKIVFHAKSLGFTAAELQARMEEMNNPARDNPIKFAREERHRKWLGIVRPEQTEIQLGDKVPSEAKDEAHWKAEGYKAGLRLLPAKPPVECAERFVQAWMKEHERGMGETNAANVPGAHRLAAQAAADFKGDNPEVDVEAAARRLKADPKFMARTPDNSAGTESVSGAESEAASVASVDIAPDNLQGADDGFEATPEELAAQAPRRALQEAAAGATSGEEIV